MSGGARAEKLECIYSNEKQVQARAELWSLVAQLDQRRKTHDDP